MDGNEKARAGVFSPRRRITMRFIASLAAGALVAGAAGAVASSTPGSSPGTAPAAVALARLSGQVHGLVRSGVDAGEAPDATPMHGLDLVLARTPAQERALDQLLAGQQDPKSAQYHQWLTPAEFGRRFGASEAAVRVLSEWLKSYGLQAAWYRRAGPPGVFRQQIAGRGRVSHADPSDRGAGRAALCERLRSVGACHRATPDPGGSRAERFQSEAGREAVEADAEGSLRRRSGRCGADRIGGACPVRVPTTRGRTSIQGTSGRAISR